MNSKHILDTNFYYTTYGFTLLSAVLEKISDRPFPELLSELFKYFDMKQTFIDENDPLIPNRSKYVFKFGPFCITLVF
jgi:serine beta-lactamase-like protein LACTB